MSSTRGGRGRGGFGFTSAQTGDVTRQPRPGFQRGRGQSGAPRGISTRGTARGTSRGRGAASSLPKASPPMTSGGDAQARFQALKKKREEERKDAIRNGFLADPDKPRTLAEAITPAGTCPDMCAEFERLERIVQKDVWSQELGEDGQPDEARMVKKFRRAAAGIDEQLPSDLRPPATLKKTCDYLFDDLIGNAESLGTVHHLVWDRTRAIRNDFSIQQITKSADVEVAIDCYERIARFHILSLHQFAVPDKPHDKYDWYQEREQLDRTLLSLMQYYDDHRGRLPLSNEPEFRAYCIVLQIQDPIPDLEERVSCYPRAVRTHPRVRAALELYSAACSIIDPQGPLKPKTRFALAREDWNAFFTKVESKAVPYLLACAAEVYFNTVRKQILNGLWRSFRRPGSSADITDLTLTYVTQLFRFDTDDQTSDFCEHYGFGFKDVPGQEDEILDINAVSGRTFPDAAQGLATQVFSQYVVEKKRLDRTFPAVIRGLTYRAAESAGLTAAPGESQYMQMDDEDSLFVQPAPASKSEISTTPVQSPFQSQPPSVTPAAASSPFQVSSNPFASAAPPSTTTPQSSPFAAKGGLADSIFAAPNAGKSANNGGSAWGKASTSGWGKPTTTGWGQASAQASTTPKASPFAPPTGSGSTSDGTQGNTVSSGITSIHAPPSFSWAKPTTPSWSSKPTESVSNEPKPSIFAKPSETPQFTEKPQPAPHSSQSPAVSTAPQFTAFPSAPSIAGPGNAGQRSIFSSQPSSVPDQKSTPVFSFGQSVLTKPADAKPADPNPSQPSFSFAKATPSGPPAKSTEQSPFNSIGQSAQTAAPKFGFASPNGESAVKTTQPAMPVFSFASANNAPKSGENVDQAQKKPFFSFESSPPIVSAANPNLSSASSDASAQQLPSSSSPYHFPTKTNPGSAKDQKSQPSTMPTSTSSQNVGPSRSTSPGLPQPNQPKKPSPLSQSFSASDRPSTTPQQSRHVTFDTPQKPPVPFTSTTPTIPPKSVEVVPAPSSRPSLPSILERLATEMLTDPTRGLLRQFVEYHARPIIMNVYEELYLEEMRQIADNHRREKIARKYGRKWRETSWKLRLARQGREKREKRRNARRERVAHDDGRKRQREENAVDEFLYRQSVRKLNAESKVGSSTAPSHRRGSVASVSTQDFGSSTMQIDDAPARPTSNDTTKTQPMNFVKPSTPVAQPESQYRASHFLGFSVPKHRSALTIGATPRQSSRSAYFRMKALGLDPNGDAVATPIVPAQSVNYKKRPRNEDESEMADVSPPAKKSRTPPSTALHAAYSRPRSYSNDSEQSSVLELSPGAGSTASHAISRIGKDSDDVLARARALRQSLRASARPQETPVRHAEQLRPLPASDATPAMSAQRARLHARLRAAERAENALAQSTRSIGVPAYRLRESRFVPREHYGRAIEKAHENTERRLQVESRGAASVVETGSLVEPAQMPTNRATSTASPLQQDAAVPVIDEKPTRSSAGPSAIPVPADRHASTDIDRNSLPPDSAHRESIDASLAMDPATELASQSTTVSLPIEPAKSPESRYAQASQTCPAQQWSFGGLQDNRILEDSTVRSSKAPSIPDIVMQEEQADREFKPQHSLGHPDLDMSRVTSSPYLSIGQDDGLASVPEESSFPQPSMYPDLSEPMGAAGISPYPTEPMHHIPHESHFDPAFDDAVNQALNMDSSLAPYMSGALPTTFEYTDEVHAEPVAPSVEMATDDALAPIDPSLLDAEVQSRDQVPSESSDVARDKQLEQTARPSSNPFAVLAGIDEEASNDGRASSVGSRRISRLSQDHSSRSIQVRSSSVASTAESDTVRIRQPDDDHFVSNGVIQDDLLQAAQRESTEPARSFTSLAQTDAATGSAGAVQVSSSSRRTTPAFDGPARHTRSRSREMSAVSASASAIQVPQSEAVNGRRSRESSVGSNVSRATGRRGKSTTPSATARLAIEKIARHNLLQESPIMEVEEEKDAEPQPGIEDVIGVKEGHKTVMNSFTGTTADSLSSSHVDQIESPVNAERDEKVPAIDTAVLFAEQALKSETAQTPMASTTTIAHNPSSIEQAVQPQLTPSEDENRVVEESDGKEGESGMSGEEEKDIHSSEEDSPAPNRPPADMRHEDGMTVSEDDSSSEASVIESNESDEEDNDEDATGTYVRARAEQLRISAFGAVNGHRSMLGATTTHPRRAPVHADDDQDGNSSEENTAAEQHHGHRPGMPRYESYDAQDEDEAGPEEDGEDEGSVAEDDEEQEEGSEEESGDYDEDDEDGDDASGAGYGSYPYAGSQGFRQAYYGQKSLMTPGEMADSGLVKSGTGQSAEDAFELSD